MISPGVGCQIPPELLEAGLLVDRNTSSLVPINDSVRFECPGGQRLDLDFDKSDFGATCLTGNQWKVEEYDRMPECIESKFTRSKCKLRVLDFLRI